MDTDKKILKLTRTEAGIMKKRGFETEEEMLDFLNMTEDRLSVFSSFHDGEEVLKGIEEAIDNKRMITVYGDYDADGVMAMTILCRGIGILAPGRVRWFANNRFEDGYSITVNSLERMLSLYPDTEVILTCDNGIGAVEAWTAALERGIRVFVTDHHEQPADRILPEEIPAVCEKSVRQREIFESQGREPENICGAELARRLINGLFDRRGISEQYREFLQQLFTYAGIATITDVVPLNACNHFVAGKAVEMIRSDEGFWKILFGELAKGQIGKADADTFGFYFGPAINACSRIDGSVELPMNVFMYDGDSESGLKELAAAMAGRNTERKEWSSQDYAACEKYIRDNGYTEDPFLLIAAEGLREGINGLSAGRLTEKYKVPSIVLGPSEKPGIYKGSARSVDSVNIFEELDACRDLLVAYGGHPKAAGLSIREEDIEELRRRLNESIPDKLVKVQTGSEEADITLDPRLFDRDYVKEIRDIFERLQPFGEGFPKPLLFMDEETADTFFMSNGVHVKYRLKEASKDNRQVNLICWNKGQQSRQWQQAHGHKNPQIRGLVTCPEINIYNGNISYQVTDTDIELYEASEGSVV